MILSIMIRKRELNDSFHTLKLYLVRGDAPIHGLDLDLGVGVDPGRDVFLGPSVLALVLLKQKNVFLTGS